VNYTQLSQSIQDYCQSTETSFVANIPNFVQLAEERIYNSVQIPAIRKNVTGTMTASFQYFQLPSDWLSTFSLAVIDGTTGEYEYLLNKDVNFIRASYPFPATTGKPKYYAIWNNTSMILGPTPDLAYSAELHYYYYPVSIVSAGTSWLGDNFETVLLYGALREAYTYLKGEQDMMTYYEQKYQEALGLLKRLGDGLDRQDAYRSGQVRIPVT
jgi:hypothetical protein